MTNICPFCDFAKSVHASVGDVEPYLFWECGECELLFLRPQPSSSVLQSIYEDQYHCHLPSQRRGFLLPFYQKLAMERQWKRVFEQQDPMGPLVDWGAGSGEWIRFAKSKGAIVLGTEISLSQRSLLQQMGLDVRDPGAPFAECSLDAIRLNHVIEHFTNPQEELQKFREYLRPGGVLFGQTPNYQCMEFKLFGRHWNQIAQPQHTHLFSLKSLDLLAEKSGFELVSFGYSPSSALNWSSSISRLLTKTCGKEYDLRKDFIYPVLTPLFIPWALLLCTIGESGCIDFIMRKK